MIRSLSHIVALTDFSNTSFYAVDAAFYLAELHRAKLTILHFIEKDYPMTVSLTDEVPLTINLKNRMDSQVVIKGWQVKGKKLSEVPTLKIVGESLEKIGEEVGIENVDCIVMGSTGWGRHQAVMGSNTYKVIQEVDIPVLVVKGPFSEKEKENIVFASNFDERDKKAFKQMLKVLNPSPEANIQLLCIDINGFYTQPSALIHQAMSDFVDMASPIKTNTAFYKDYSVRAGLRHFTNQTETGTLAMAHHSKSLIKEIWRPSPALASAEYVQFPVLILQS